MLSRDSQEVQEVHKQNRSSSRLGSSQTEQEAESFVLSCGHGLLPGVGLDRRFGPRPPGKGGGLLRGTAPHGRRTPGRQHGGGRGSAGKRGSSERGRPLRGRAVGPALGGAEAAAGPRRGRTGAAGLDGDGRTGARRRRSGRLDGRGPLSALCLPVDGKRHKGGGTVEAFPEAPLGAKCQKKKTQPGSGRRQRRRNGGHFPRRSSNGRDGPGDPTDGTEAVPPLRPHRPGVPLELLRGGGVLLRSGGGQAF